MMTREENVRRILRGVQDGSVRLADLNDVDRKDLTAFDSLDLTAWERNLSSASQVYGELTLREVKEAKELSKQLQK